MDQSEIIRRTFDILNYYNVMEKDLTRPYSYYVYMNQRINFYTLGDNLDNLSALDNLSLNYKIILKTKYINEIVKRVIGCIFKLVYENDINMLKIIMERDNQLKEDCINGLNKFDLNEMNSLDSEIDRHAYMLYKNIKPVYYGWLDRIDESHMLILDNQITIVSIEDIIHRLDENNPGIIYGG